MTRLSLARYVVVTYVEYRAQSSLFTMPMTSSESGMTASPTDILLTCVESKCSCLEASFALTRALGPSPVHSVHVYYAGQFSGAGYRMP
jgi:hypothetical protein